MTYPDIISGCQKSNLNGSYSSICVSYPILKKYSKLRIIIDKTYKTSLQFNGSNFHHKHDLKIQFDSVPNALKVPIASSCIKFLTLGVLPKILQVW